MRYLTPSRKGSCGHAPFRTGAGLRERSAASFSSAEAGGARYGRGVDRIERAAALARVLARSSGVPARAEGTLRRVRVAVGDPQAPLETVLGVLDHNGLLAENGRLREDVALYSMGDHFDWGAAAEAEQAGEDGLALLAWLASHAVDHVHLVLGNHDLARVGELASFDDAGFRAARALAVDAYTRGDERAERDLLRRFPALPTAEVAARDFASFSVAQRELVAWLLRARRFRIAFALGDDVLLTHAGVASREVALDPLARRAQGIAAALNARLDGAVSAWGAGALTIPGLYEPGSAARGEAGGLFYHRPTSEPVTVANGGRRFDPRTIPPGITQVVGHVGDEKCRALMPRWSLGAPTEGALRSLIAGEDGAVRYASGVQAMPASNEGRGAGRIVFTDGTMRRTPIGAYEVLDLDRMAPFVPRLSAR